MIPGSIWPYELMDIDDLNLYIAHSTGGELYVILLFEEGTDE